MKTGLSNPLARVLDTVLCLITSFITGVTSKQASDLAFTPTNKVYYANHASHGDFVLVWISLPKTWRMLTQPVAGADYWLGSKLKAFIAEQVFRVLLIDRQSDPKQAIAAMDGALKEGKSLILFPEGTRIPRGQTGKYKTGGTRLAIATGAPVIPVAVSSAKCWPKKAFIKTPGVIDISIGKPIPSVGREPGELMAEVEAWIEAEMRRLDPDAYK